MAVVASTQSPRECSGCFFPHFSVALDNSHPRSGNMTCSRCGRELAEGARFCSQCGSAQGPRCSACGDPVSDDAEFCDQCEAELAPVAAESLLSGAEQQPDEASATCSRCGTELPETASFCSSCGEAVSVATGKTTEGSETPPGARHVGTAGRRVDEASSGLAQLPTLHKVIGGAAAVVAISAFLPWLSIFGISVIGISTGGGTATFVLASIGLATLAAHWGMGPVRVSEHAFAVSEAVVGLLCLIIALGSIASSRGLATIGLYLTLLASIGWTGASFTVWRGLGGE